MGLPVVFVLSVVVGDVVVGIGCAIAVLVMSLVVWGLARPIYHPHLSCLEGALELLLPVTVCILQ